MGGHHRKDSFVFYFFLRGRVIYRIYRLKKSYCKFHFRVPSFASSFFTSSGKLKISHQLDASSILETVYDSESFLRSIIFLKRWRGVGGIGQFF